jgi:hypothetical protein
MTQFRSRSFSKKSRFNLFVTREFSESVCLSASRKDVPPLALRVETPERPDAGVFWRLVSFMKRLHGQRSKFRSVRGGRHWGN